MDRRHIPLTNTLEAFTVMGSFSYAAYSTAKAVMVALFYVLFFGLGFDFRQNPRILAVIAIHAERENHCTIELMLLFERGILQILAVIFHQDFKHHNRTTSCGRGALVLAVNRRRGNVFCRPIIRFIRRWRR